MGTITVWLKAGHTVAVIAEMAGEFERATGVHLDVRVVPESEAHDGLVAREARPDVVTVPFWYLDELLQARTLRPAELPADASFHPKAVEALSRDGVTWAVPHTLTGATLSYRADLLEARGLGVPTTTGEIVALADALHADGLLFAARANATFSTLETYAGWAHARGLRLMPDDGEPSAHNLEAGVSDLVGLLQRQRGGLESLDYAGVGELVVRGRAAALLDTSAWAFRFEAPDSPVRGRIGYATVADRNPVQFTYAEGLGVTEWCADVEAARAFIAWRHSEPVVRRELEQVRRIDLPRLDLPGYWWFQEFVEREGLATCLRAVHASWGTVALEHVARRTDYVSAARRLMGVISGTVSGRYHTLTEGHAVVYGAGVPRP